MRALRFLVLACCIGVASAAAPLRLAFNTLPPWKQYDAQGKPEGAYWEIARELARRTGLDAQAIDCPLKRCLAMLEQGQLDMAIGLQSSPDREQYLAFLHTPYRQHSSDKVFYLRRGEGTRLGRYEDLYGLTIGMRLGSEVFDRFDLDTKLHKEATPDNATNMRKLLGRRIDAVVLAEDQGEFLLATLRMGQDVEKAAYRMPDGGPRSAALSRKSPLFARRAELESAMTAMKADGTLKRIYQAYYYQRYGIAEGAIQVE